MASQEFRSASAIVPAHLTFAMAGPSPHASSRALHLSSELLFVLHSDRKDFLNCGLAMEASVLPVPWR